MKDKRYKPISFIEESIEPIFNNQPILEKKPICPDGFRWKDIEYTIASLLLEWHDYQRRGRYARNMQPQHAVVAQARGSWGVGKFYFRVKTDQNRIFDIYYDRLPKDVNSRKGSWHIFQELVKS